MPATVHRFRPPAGDNLQHLLIEGRECLIVDPFDDRAVLREVDALALEAVGVALTHTHWDHVNGVQGVVRARPMPVWVHPDGRADVPAEADVRPLRDGMTIPFGAGVGVIEAPGHHPTHVLLRHGDTLVVGDVLFLAGCGNANFGGDVELLFATLHERVRRMDPALRLAWGHDYAESNLRFARLVDPGNAELPALVDAIARDRAVGELPPWRTLADELRINPFLRCGEEALWRAAQRALPECPRQPRAVFRQLRHMRDEFS